MKEQIEINEIRNVFSIIYYLIKNKMYEKCTNSMMIYKHDMYLILSLL